MLEFTQEDLPNIKTPYPPCVWGSYPHEDKMYFQTDILVDYLMRTVDDLAGRLKKIEEANYGSIHAD